MQNVLPSPLKRLSDALDAPLYVVGGSVRDFLSGQTSGFTDWDLCSPATEQALVDAAEKCAFTVCAVYRHTGTVKLEDENGVGYEFTRFRSDTYVRGVHTPDKIQFTTDIATDARRRDFCANAVYYDVSADAYCDPLGGMEDVRLKRLRTVAPATKVFGEDGLRLMRLARIAAQTGFTPDQACLDGARANRTLISDIAPERVFTELELLLHSDKKAGELAPYRGLKLLHETGVLSRIMPELTAGEHMAQRSDFHRYDVLEHSLRCVRYSPSSVRWAALLHDVGKPACMMTDGNFHDHAMRGGAIAENILTRLKAPKKLIEETRMLVERHMRDFDLRMREGKVRREIVQNYPLLQKLFDLKQADFSACKDDTSPAPAVQKWKSVLDRMREEGVPFCLKELTVNGEDARRAGLTDEQIGRALNLLWDFCTQDGRRNQRELLLRRLKTINQEKLC